MRRFKDNILKDKKFLKEIAIILIVGIIVNAFCFLLPLVVHAETINSVLPYLCQNDNSFYSEEDVQNALSVINDKYPNADIYNKKFFVCYGVHHIWYTYNDYIEVPAYYVYTCPDNMILPTTWSNNSTFENFQFNDSSSYIDVSLGNYKRYIVAPRSTSIDSSGYYCNEFDGGTVRLFGTVTTHNISNNYFEVTVPGLNYPVYTTSQFSTVDRSANQGYILAFADTIIYPGDFSDLPSLDELLDNISNSFSGGTSGSTNTPDQNKTDIQNFADFFNNLQSSINSNINNLGQNIKGWFDNLQKKLTDVANAISNNIWNGFSTLMNNIKDFLSPKLDYILEKLDYITEPFNQEEINDFIESSDIYSDVSSLQTSVSNFTSSLTGVSEPNSYSITLHIEDIGILHQEQPFILSFDILNDVKVYIRGFLWCFCTYGLFISIVDSFANYINGGGGEDD